MIRVSLLATENAKPQYIKVRSPEDNPFLKFQAVDLRFDLAIWQINRSWPWLSISLSVLYRAYHGYARRGGCESPKGMQTYSLWKELRRLVTF